MSPRNDKMSRWEEDVTPWLISKLSQKTSFLLVFAKIILLNISQFITWDAFQGGYLTFNVFQISRVNRFTMISQLLSVIKSNKTNGTSIQWCRNFSDLISTCVKRYSFNSSSQFTDWILVVWHLESNDINELWNTWITTKSSNPLIESFSFILVRLNWLVVKVRECNWNGTHLWQINIKIFIVISCSCLTNDAAIIEMTMISSSAASSSSNVGKVKEQ